MARIGLQVPAVFNVCSHIGYWITFGTWCGVQYQDMLHHCLPFRSSKGCVTSHVIVNWPSCKSQLPRESPGKKKKEKPTCLCILCSRCLHRQGESKRFFFPRTILLPWCVHCSNILFTFAQALLLIYFFFSFFTMFKEYCGAPLNIQECKNLPNWLIELLLPRLK